MTPPDLPSCPVPGCVEPCQHEDQRALVYTVPEALRTPTRGTQKAVRAVPVARIEYAGPEWWLGPLSPLSSDITQVRTYDHSWCATGKIDKSPHVPGGVVATCIHGKKYPVRPREPGDGGPGQQ
mgnify:CR=1 FL=1